MLGQKKRPVRIRICVGLNIVATAATFGGIHLTAHLDNST
jgi:hypothetical protein